MGSRISLETGPIALFINTTAPFSASPSWQQQISGAGQAKRVSTHTVVYKTRTLVSHETTIKFPSWHLLLAVSSVVSLPQGYRAPGHRAAWSSRTQRGKAVSSWSWSHIVVQQPEFKGWLQCLLTIAVVFYFPMPSNRTQAPWKINEGQFTMRVEKESFKGNWAKKKKKNG